jgi:hypothetical protein
MSTLTRRTALQLNAIVAVLCMAVAAALISLVLTEPETVAAAVAQHHYGTVVTAVIREVAGWLHALLRYL